MSKLFLALVMLVPLSYAQANEVDARGTRAVASAARTLQTSAQGLAKAASQVVRNARANRNLPRVAKFRTLAQEARQLARAANRTVLTPARNGNAVRAKRGVTQLSRHVRQLRQAKRAIRNLPPHVAKKFRTVNGAIRTLNREGQRLGNGRGGLVVGQR
jgi:hypothetical protein